MKKLSDRQKQMIFDYNLGMSSIEAAKKSGFKTHKSCLYALKIAGIKSKSQNFYRIYDYNIDYFKIIDIEDKAYWLGFLTADGCLSEKRCDGGSIRLGLSSKDDIHLEKFNKNLNSNLPIVRSKRIVLGKEYQVSTIDINCTNMYNDLLKYGLTPRKSLTIKPYKFEDNELQRHYWRGVFDGDGAVYYKIINPNNTSWRFDLCGSKDMVEQYSNWIKQEINEDISVVPKRGIYYACCTGRQKPAKLAKLLYSNCTIFLDRKKELVDKLLSEIK